MPELFPERHILGVVYLVGSLLPSVITMELTEFYRAFVFDFLNAALTPSQNTSTTSSTHAAASSSRTTARGAPTLHPAPSCAASASTRARRGTP